MEFDPAGKPQGGVARGLGCGGTVIIAFPLPSRAPSPRKTGPRRVAVTVPVGTGAVETGAATTIVNVTGCAKTEGFAFEVTVKVTPTALLDCACKGNRGAERSRAATAALNLQLSWNTGSPNRT